MQAHKKSKMHGRNKHEDLHCLDTAVARQSAGNKDDAAARKHRGWQRLADGFEITAHANVLRDEAEMSTKEMTKTILMATQHHHEEDGAKSDEAKKAVALAKSRFLGGLKKKRAREGARKGSNFLRPGTTSVHTQVGWIA